MNAAYLIIAQLWIYPEMEARFAEFEKKAAANMAKHGGKIERAFRSEPHDAIDPEIPYETHVVSFPSKEKFEAYRCDPDSLDLAEERATIIRKTVAWPCRDCGEEY